MTSAGVEQETQPGVDAAQATGAEAADAPAEPGRGHRKVREGLVVSNKMDKTAVVSVDDHVKHSLYGKVIRRSRKYKAHDERNECAVGDRVQLMETRPISATKRWRVVNIVQKAR